VGIAAKLPFPSILIVLIIVGMIDLSSLQSVTAAPELSLSPSSGHVGETINVSGSGFAPLVSIEVLFNDVPVSTDPENIRTNLSGRFDAEFDVPQSGAGSVVVTARERLLADFATADFVVINEAPIAENLAVSTHEDIALEIALSGTDTNGDALVFSIVQNPENGVLTGFDEGSGTGTYTPNANYNGDDAFTFKVNDGLQDSDIAEVSIEIVAVNDPPLTEDQELTVMENGEVDVTLIGSDPDGDELSFSIVEGPVSGTLAGEPPNLVYRPSAGFSGTDSFSFVANDGTVDSNVSQVNITVLPVNDAPSAEDVEVETNEDEPVAVTLTASDPDSDSLTFVIMSQPSHGTLGEIMPVNSTSATVVYAPTANFNGADNFTFRVHDGDPK
jgi:hypothetical protein